MKRDIALPKFTCIICKGLQHANYRESDLAEVLKRSQIWQLTRFLHINTFIVYGFAILRKVLKSKFTISKTFFRISIYVLLNSKYITQNQNIPSLNKSIFSQTNVSDGRLNAQKLFLCWIRHFRGGMEHKSL